MLTFLRQPWHIAGFALQSCCTNWLFGIDGGNQKKSAISATVFFYMFGWNDPGFVVFQSKWFVFA